ncbi:MAG: erythromycin biosynthesis sensory transduction protein eryC1 [Acidobacteria bacterium]|nr:MAG: erythromycin biosynthesis sensory transduction protein eryC1 [Acidobacteriota bacterium]
MIGDGRIPFLDLVTPHLELEEELVSVFRDVLKTAGFVGGPMVEEFEAEFAQFCGAEYCVGVGSGTDALRLALIAAGVRPGDIVITVPNTFIATAEAISQAGARPDFVDIDEHTYNLDPRGLREYLETQCRFDSTTGGLLNLKTERPVRGIVPVHLYGQMADMDPILDLAARYNLLVIEDACQAQGAAYDSQRAGRWMKAGSMGLAAAFSFYPGKNLGACGEAGAVTTNDQGLRDRVRMLRDHGQRRKYYHEIEGYNGRLDALQAGILRAKLPRLPKWNQKRRAIARRYNELFRSQTDTIVLPCISPGSKSVYHLYVIRVKNRDQLRESLEQANIATQIHYPTPLHLQRAYSNLGYQAGDFPVAEKVAAEVLSLPIYPQLKARQQKRIAGEVVASLETRRASDRTAREVPCAAWEEHAA